MKHFSIWICSALAYAALTQSLHAQVITNAEVERGLRFRGTPAWDAEPYTQRYSYGMANAPIYLNGNPRMLYYLDYLDRADRAEKFGYPMPIDPFFETVEPAPAPPPPSVRVGLGFGILRRR